MSEAESLVQNAIQSLIVIISWGLTVAVETANSTWMGPMVQQYVLRLQSKRKTLRQNLHSKALLNPDSSILGICTLKTH